MKGINLFYKIDLVNAKSGKILKWWENWINYAANKFATWLTIIAVLSCCIFICYLGYKLVVFLIAV